MYAASLSLKDARAQYFSDNGFGEDGGYGKKWVPLKLGPIRFAIPNTKERVRAVVRHDLHHVLTDYRADWRGEFEISAWEISTGCRDFYAAWVLNLWGMAAGLLSYPRAVFAAFVRGQHSRNFYHAAYDDALLATKVGDARAALGLDAPHRATAKDVAVFAGYSLLALLFSFVTVVLPWVGLVALVRAVG